MDKLLIVVDMINGFIKEGALHDEAIATALPACESRVQEFLKNGDEVIAFCDNHQEESREFAAFPLHCLAGSKESELVEELAAYQQEMTIIPKNSTNGFFAPGFAPYLAKLANYREVLIIGCCTDICVLQLALSLKAYCNQHDYATEILVDVAACETFEIPGHQRQQYNELSFNLMKASGIKLLNEEKRLTDE